MSTPAIEVRGLGKQYRIGAAQARYKTLRESLTDAVTAPLRRMAGGDREAASIWALNEVSFQIAPGEVVGVIGRNGAGKSTLLKLLSRITAPTAGEVRIHGRVGSLLEVGTGFHPELTGRENIFLNGAILGMRRAEIEKRFDAIVAFSEVEKFIDTPMKHFSSGMFMRLAFAVAAHLEPDILLVDEVLAVGDAAFQKKCLGRMSEVGRQGRTVLFVSHDMAAIGGLTKRCLWLDGGRLRRDGPTAEVTTSYLTEMSSRAREGGVDALPRVTGGQAIRLTGLEVMNGDRAPNTQFRYGEPMVLRFEFAVREPGKRYFAIEWTIASASGEKALYASSSPQGTLLIEPDAATGAVECRIDQLPLSAGTYFVHCLLSIPHQERLDQVEAAATFDVVTCDPYGTGFNVDHRLALATVPTRWNIVSGGRSHLEPAGAPR